MLTVQELLKAETKGGEDERAASSLHAVVQAKDSVFFSGTRQFAREKQHCKKHSLGNSSHFHKTADYSGFIAGEGITICR